MALLFQVLLVAIVAGPTTTEPRPNAPAAPGAYVQSRPVDPLFSEVLSAKSRPATATSAPRPAPIRRATAPPSAPETVRPVAAAPTSTPPPPPPPVSLPDGCERIIMLVNQVRQEDGLAALAYNPLLGTAAQRYADFLAAHDVLNHTADGRTLDARAETAGYTTWVSLGENLAGGYTSFEEALAAWLGSPDHRDNIMNPAFTETGVGCAWNAGTAYGSFFVQEFGTS